MFKKILRAVKGTSKKDAFYGFLFKTLRFKPHNEKLYELAFRHKSASIYRGNNKINNERLEYLGDAVFGAVVADLLYQFFPHQKEGFLTKLRSKIVNRQQMNEIGKKMQLDEYLQYSGTMAHNVLGNCLEALVGAVYLDQGYAKTRRFIVKQIIEKYINFEVLMKTDENFKSRLVEWGQSHKKDVVFDTQEIEAEEKPLFNTKILIDSKVYGEGKGASKKESQQLAAQKALVRIKKS